MTDLTYEERKKKIQRQWLKRIERDHALYSRKLNDPDITPENEKLVRGLLDQITTLKNKILSGWTPTEPPLTGWERVNGEFVPLKEEETGLEELDRICFDPEDTDELDIIPADDPELIREIQTKWIRRLTADEIRIQEILSGEGSRWRENSLKESLMLCQCLRREIEKGFYPDKPPENALKVVRRITDQDYKDLNFYVRNNCNAVLFYDAEKEAEKETNRRAWEWTKMYDPAWNWKYVKEQKEKASKRTTRNILLMLLGAFTLSSILVGISQTFNLIGSIFAWFILYCFFVHPFVSIIIYFSNALINGYKNKWK